MLIEVEFQQIVRYDRGRSAPRLLTLVGVRQAGVGRRRRASPDRRDPEPLGVEGAWVSAREDPGSPWLWVIPVVGLYVLVAFFS